MLAGPLAFVLLALWLLAATTLLYREPFGIDEGIARGLLLLWSIADRVGNPVITLSVPDARAIVLAPVGVLFAGSVLAAKLETLGIGLLCALALHARRKGQGAADSTLPATALLLLSPLMLSQVDTIGTGPFLLAALLAGAWAHEVHRGERVAFGGYYFLQLALCFAAVSLHPAGLALPLLLAIHWWRAASRAQPATQAVLPGSNRLHMLVGVAITTVAGVALAWGWPHLAWLQAPPVALSLALLAWFPDHAALSWIVGTVLLASLVGMFVADRAQLREDPLLAMLCLALVLGLPAADAGWALLALVVLVHWGLARLLHARLGGGRGSAAQRAFAFTVLVIAFTGFLSQDRLHWQLLRAGLPLSPTDALIHTLADVVQQSAKAAGDAGGAGGAGGGHAEDAPPPGPGAPADEDTEGPVGSRTAVRVASQWPGRTMVACACTVLPLPPALEDAGRFVANLRGLSWVLFDARDPAQAALRGNFAMLGGGIVETISIQPGGVLLRVLPQGADPAPPDPHAVPRGAPAAPKAPGTRTDSRTDSRADSGADWLKGSEGRTDA
jgi:hypothetical protein